MSNDSQNAEIVKASGTSVSFTMPNTDSLATLESMDVKFNLNVKYKKKDDCSSPYESIVLNIGALWNPLCSL